MNFVVYFRIALFTPILMALIGLIWPGGMQVGLFQIAIAAVTLAFIPYALFVAGALIWSIKRSEDVVFKAIWWAAPVFAVMCFLYFLIGPFPTSGNGGMGLSSAFIISIFALFYGFFCLLIALVGWVLIQLVRGKSHF